jgi:mannose-1-phosphate guanylyltransferase
MVPIANRPFLEHMIEHLKSHGIKDIILALCYLPGLIQEHFKDRADWGVKLSYVVEPSPLGTAGAVKNVEELLDDSFVVCNGDILTDLDIGAMYASHTKNGAEATIALTPADDPTLYGVIETDEQMRVHRFIEKPSWDAITSNLINAGTYILEPSVLDIVPKDEYYMFEQGLFPTLLHSDRLICAHPSQGYWIDIGTPQKYLTANHDVMLGRAKHNLLGEPDHEQIWLGKDCQVDPSARISGPVVIGSDSKIGPGVQITGPTVLGSGTEIGEGSDIEGAVIWNDTTLGQRVVIHNAVIADACQMSDDVWLGEGTVLGSNVQVGSGNRLERGIRVWPERILEPNTISF